MITYGSVIWAFRIPSGSSTLKRVQRLALLLMGDFLASTPTAALEVLLNLVPLDIFVRGEAIATAARIGNVDPGWDGIGDGNYRGHLLSLIHI